MAEIKLHIVPWSGGPDSTVVLKNLLETAPAQDIIVTSSVVATSPQFSYNTRWSERLVRDKLEPILKEIRDFDRYDFYTHEPIRTHSNNTQINTINYYIAYKYKFDVGYNYLCRCLDDKKAKVYNEPGIVNANKLIRKMNTKYNIEYFELNWDKPKSQILEELGWDIWNTTFSCFTPPTLLEPCGNCIRCEERRIAENDARI